MRHDDLLGPVDRRLRVVALDEAVLGQEHAAVREMSVKLRCPHLGIGRFSRGAGEEPAPERLQVLRLAFLLRCAFGFGFRRRGSCGLRLKRLSGFADFGQALLFVSDPAGHFVAATACAMQFVLLRVGCFRSFKPAIHFGAKLRLTRLHAFVAHRLVFGGVRLDLRAVERAEACPSFASPAFSASFSTCKNSLPSGGR